MHTYYFRQAIGNMVGPEIDAFCSEFYNGQDASRVPLGYRIFGGGGESRRILKNIYIVPDAFIVSMTLILRHELASVVKNHIDCNLIAATIEKAFYYPFMPGDTRFEDEDHYQEFLRKSDPDFDVNKLYNHFVAPFEVAPPPIPLFEVLCHDRREALDKPDRVDYRVGDPMRGVAYETLAVSKSLVLRYGMMSGFGWICTEHVFNVLKPFIDNPFFFWQRVEGCPVVSHR